MESHLDRLVPAPQVEPAVPNANPLRGLLHVSIIIERTYKLKP